ncbi:hypothetical protein CUJ84_Chr002225 [Rhizobium leguminosarum]|uniref:Uncharacterized protein n=1 Tax=Rhizobium leguminosarum TaxID=384 RepID=A0A2K9Z2W9_RHILE|nr:hypothetical protein CUJ84_Chr002225 [Rhizobium leguminosarum]
MPPRPEGILAGHGRQADNGIIAHFSDSFQRDLTGSLDRPFVVLFEQESADETHDGILVGKGPDGLGASFDLAV